MADGITAEEKARRCALVKCPLAGHSDERCAKCTGPVAWKDADGRRCGRARSCTSCPMDGLGLPVCWAACPGPNTDFTTDGQSMVTLGGMPDPDKYVDIYESYDSRLARLPSADFHTRLTPDAEAAARRLVGIFAGLTMEQLRVLHAMLNAGTGTGAALALGVTKQSVNQASNRIAEKFPALRPFLFASERE